MVMRISTPDPLFLYSLLQLSKDYSGRSESAAPFDGQVLGPLLVLTVEDRQSWCPRRLVVSFRGEYISIGCK